MNLHSLLENARRYLDTESESSTYLLEATNINKDYLKKQCEINELDFSEIMTTSNDFINELEKGVNKITNNQNTRAKFINLLTLMNIKASGEFLTQTFLADLHDAIIKKSNLVDSLMQNKNINSDSSPEDIVNAIHRLSETAKQKFKLNAEDLRIWNRVKTAIDYNDGFKWVYAVDEHGEAVGYIPSRITNVTMKHCGNEPSVQPGDVYWELRDNDNNAYLTVILNDGDIEEAKSYGNKQSTYAKQIYKYVEDFYKSKYVNGVGHRYDYGYAVDSNFSVSYIASFDPQFLTWVEENKPSLLGKTEKLIMKHKCNSVKEAKRLTNMYIKKPSALGHNNWTVYLACIGGIDNLHKFFSEDDIINYFIKPKTIKLEQFANADIKALTPRIQRAFVKYQNGFSTLFSIMQQVHAFYIDERILEFLKNKNYKQFICHIMDLPDFKIKRLQNYGVLTDNERSI